MFIINVEQTKEGDKTILKFERDMTNEEQSTIAGIFMLMSGSNDYHWRDSAHFECSLPFHMEVTFPLTFAAALQTSLDVTV